MSAAFEQPPVCVERALRQAGIGWAPSDDSEGKFDADRCPACGGAMTMQWLGEDGFVFNCHGDLDSHEAIGATLGIDPGEMPAWTDPENGAFAAAVLPEGPFSLTLDEFVAAQHDAPPALIGTDHDCLIPAGGFGMLVARGGKGKTSLIVDLALHAASGIEWLGIPIERPLRVLIVENEGPREMFRRKLERRAAGWEHDTGGRLHIHVRDWAAFRLDDAAVVQLNAACDELGIDLVIGDPLDSLGMEGEGSPSEARRMVDRLKAAGLATSRAWLLLHHPRKANDLDAVDAASGDWGGRPDLILRLDRLDGNRARLTFPKVRWAGRERAGHILAFDPDTGAFELVAEEGADERDLGVEVAEFLDAHPLRTAKEIAAPAPAGIGASERAIRDLLEGDPERFDLVTGDDAKAIERHPSARLWKVSPASNSPDSPRELSGEGVGESAPLPPRRGGGPDSPAPPGDSSLDSPAPPEADPVAEADSIAAKYKGPNPKGAA